MPSRHAIVALLLTIFITITLSSFTPHFEHFLRKNYGFKFLRRMERLDMGDGIMGSFGGKEYDNDTISHHPVIFVHGVTLRAGFFLGHISYFKDNNYTSAELYGTTYADGGITPMLSVTMTCENVLQIRDFIQSVSSYTNSPVDVIGYSMGVALSRKAILGGHCVDTGEYLGLPLTSIVDTFVAVAGVVNGYENCLPFVPACNNVNGMICTSDFLQNVNSVDDRFEAAHTFVIYSIDDHIVGQDCCGKQCSALPHANYTSKLEFLNHLTIVTLTKDIQLRMVRDHATP